MGCAWFCEGVTSGMLLRQMQGCGTPLDVKELTTSLYDSNGMCLPDVGSTKNKSCVGLVVGHVGSIPLRNVFESVDMVEAYGRMYRV